MGLPRRITLGSHSDRLCGMAKTADDFSRELERAFDAMAFYDELSSRVQAIEELLQEKHLIPARLLNQRQKTILAKLSEKRREYYAEYAKKVFAERKRRQRKLLDKASGPIQ
jgi:hypothetical protein